MTMHGIMNKVELKNDIYHWVLADNWQTKTIVVCLDSLRLDRHRLFSSKLSNIQMSFTQSYKQSLIFQKVLSRVIEISSPLHMAFHMLQSIFSIYKLVIKSTQSCLGWKKVNLQKVSEIYRTCVSMATILYEELFRYLFLSFLEKFSAINVFPSFATSEEDESLLFVLLREFKTYVDTKLKTTKDQRWMYMYGFYKVMSLFICCP